MHTHRNRTLHRLRRNWDNEANKILDQMSKNSMDVVNELGVNIWNDYDPKWSQHHKETEKRNAQLELQLEVYYKCKFPSR